MATFLRRPCLFLTLWMAGSRRPAITRTVVSDPCVKYTGSVEIRRAAEPLGGVRNLVSPRVTAPACNYLLLTFAAGGGLPFRWLAGQERELGPCEFSLIRGH